MLTAFGAGGDFSVGSEGATGSVTGGGTTGSGSVTTPTPASTARAIDAFIQKSALNPTYTPRVAAPPPGMGAEVKPFYKKWPFWAIVGGVVIVGGGYAVLR
jgi:hypothetical protein